ncbi:hypothetical protein [Solwaraspora sp. WMMD792]|uniref:hypothetical protein n=1 Tax=Solwaraspora sp. WMMD792 TaxID=3016099 RepID=UPI002416943B|nr:hypothetical protein [Solwaraspora sp. WMMD792]MDG4771538.1 hypothetical protein [Solwaraspora sp. WMMD792]
MRLLVHITGEADLLLRADGPTPKTVRADRVQARCRQLAATAAGPAGSSAARRLLIDGTWEDDHPRTAAPSPLLGALTRLTETSDLDVLVIGTRQQPPDDLDTAPIAQTLAEALRTGTGDAATIHTIAAATIEGLAEVDVIHAVAAHLDRSPRYTEAMVTWGSGSTTLAMGVLTALSQAGLPWRLIVTNGRTAYEIVDPQDRLDRDPVAGVLVRWRMFQALADLALTDPPMVGLTDDGHDLVRRAAERHDRGFAAYDTASLRAVLADAVVRRDGTASLAVRRYVVSRYEELLELDQIDHPWAEDLLRRYEQPSGGPPLGAKLGMIAHDRHDDPMICASVDLPSYRWLYGSEVASLQNIGKGSHNLRPPTACDASFIGDYLTRFAVDGDGWSNAGLPEPRVAPADTVLAVWPAGTARRGAAEKFIGDQLSSDIPAAVRDFLDVGDTRLRAVIFAVDDGQGSLDIATADAASIATITHNVTGAARGESWVEPITLTDIDETAIERAIEARLTRETGALLLIPTGHKPVVLALIRAMRLIGARHGIPLFVRENATPANGTGYRDVHLWPAITGGDLPLLIAAERALRSLELDVAWRLLAASAIGKTVTDQARRLADAFASRQPPDGRRQTAASATDTSWTKGLAVQRLELVHAALDQATTQAARIRLLVLAADALEASIAATNPKDTKGGTYRKFRDDLRDSKIKDRGMTQAWPAHILLLLNRARDRAPITHGTGTTADAVIAEAADAHAQKRKLSTADAALLPRTLPELLHRSVEAAAALGGLGKAGQAGSLLHRHRQLLGEVSGCIRGRPQPTR